MPSLLLPSPSLQQSRQFSAAFTFSNAASQLGETGADASTQKLFLLVGLITNEREIAEFQQNHASFHLPSLHKHTGDDMALWSSVQVSMDCCSLHDIHFSLSSILITSMLVRQQLSTLTLTTILSLLAPQIFQYRRSLFRCVLT